MNAPWCTSGHSADIGGLQDRPRRLSDMRPGHGAHPSILSGTQSARSEPSTFGDMRSPLTQVTRIGAVLIEIDLLGATWRASGAGPTSRCAWIVQSTGAIPQRGGYRDRFDRHRAERRRAPGNASRRELAAGPNGLLSAGAAGPSRQPPGLVRKRPQPAIRRLLEEPAGDHRHRRALRPHRGRRRDQRPVGCPLLSRRSTGREDLDLG
jgi:hypothetical protein